MTDFRDYRAERRDRRFGRNRDLNGNRHVITGLVLVVIGALALARSFGVYMPEWLFSWQMLLMGIGILIGIKKKFTGGWFVPLLIGAVFFAEEFLMQGNMREHMWPLIIIILGIIFVVRPKRSGRFGRCDEKKNPSPEATTIEPIDESSYSQDDFIDSTSIFGSDKKTILSKNFKGGDITNIFGGSEIDLTQADMLSGAAVLDVTAMFGGATIIVPSHWVVRSEAVTIFGGIADKRKFVYFSDNAVKTIVIKGTIVCGGIEIKSY